MTSFSNDALTNNAASSQQQLATDSADSGPVQAYAKLEGENFCYYVRTLQVTMGRKVSKPNSVDITLGTMKSVSRHHARLFYNFTTQRFELMVFGKNGAFINERFVEKGATVALENRTKIQIGDVSFTFLLPRVDREEQQQSQSENTRCISRPQQQLENPTTRPEQLERESSTNDNNTTDNTTTNNNNADATGPDKKGKPPYSYATLIAQAINSAPDKRMTLAGIYAYLQERYSYFQNLETTGWQNSVRHNLSLNKAFVRVPRSANDCGKGAYWTIDPESEHQFAGGVYKPNKRTTKDQNYSSDQESRKRGRSSNSAAVSDEQGMTTSKQKSEQQQQQQQQQPSSVSPEPSTHQASASPCEAANTTSTPSAVSLESANTTRASESQSSSDMQMRLQNMIRQHLLDPIKYPLPPNVAQLLPQAIAKLPPHLAQQLNLTLQSALRLNGGGTQNASNAQASASVSETINQSTRDSPVAADDSNVQIKTEPVNQQTSPATCTNTTTTSPLPSATTEPANSSSPQAPPTN